MGKKNFNATLCVVCVLRGRRSYRLPQLNIGRHREWQVGLRQTTLICMKHKADSSLMSSSIFSESCTDLTIYSSNILRACVQGIRILGLDCPADRYNSFPQSASRNMWSLTQIMNEQVLKANL